MDILDILMQAVAFIVDPPQIKMECCRFTSKSTHSFLKKKQTEDTLFGCWIYTRHYPVFQNESLFGNTLKMTNWLFPEGRVPPLKTNFFSFVSLCWDFACCLNVPWLINLFSFWFCYDRGPALQPKQTLTLCLKQFIPIWNTT